MDADKTREAQYLLGEMGIKDYHREYTFAFALSDKPTNETFNYDTKTWNLFLGQVKTWAATKPIPVKSYTASGQIYQAIHNPFEIRVLKLHPGSGTEPLQGTLRHCTVEYNDRADGYSPLFTLSMADLTTPVCYTALSYTWGPSVFEGAISCNGHEKRITKPLEAALRQFRQPSHSIFLWIDQICINQDDEKEKEMQIPLMGRIYTLSRNTVIWLGPEGDGSQAAMQLLNRINACLQFVTAQVDSRELEAYRLPSADSDAWKSLWCLLSRPWFTRVWIVQETMLPDVDNLWVACGGEMTDWRTLDDSCNDLVTCGISRWLHGKYAPAGTMGNDVCEKVQQLGLLRSDCLVPDAPNVDIFKLLVETRTSQCFDQRDKVYGLLGVCRKDDRTPIKVSYAKDYAHTGLYRDIAIRDLQKGWYRLDYILSFVDHESPGLPSWVPDWSAPCPMIPLGSNWASSMYNACGDFTLKTRGPDSLSVESESNELRVRGIYVDTIAKLGDVFTNPELTHINPTVDNKTLLACVDFVLQFSGELPSSGTSFDTFWRTLVAGKDGDAKFPCPPSFAEIFSLLIDESTGRSPSFPDQTYSPRQKRPAGRGRLELSNLGSRSHGQVFQEARTAMRRALQHRRLGVTEKGYLGLFPWRSRGGDALHVLCNCPLPSVLRSAGNGKWRVVGECYVYGLMNAEAIEKQLGAECDINIV